MHRWPPARIPGASRIATLALLLVLVQAAAAETLRDPGSHFFHETFGDFGEELAAAREEGKQGVVLFFEMDECPFCQRMKETVLNRASVQDWYRERFRCFSVDIEGDVEITDFQGRTMASKDFAFKVNKVRATPVFAFYDLQGRQVVRYTGATRDAEEFLLLGEFAAGGHYESTNFTRFKRERRRAGARGSTSQ